MRIAGLWRRTIYMLLGLMLILAACAGNGTEDGTPEGESPGGANQTAPEGEAPPADMETPDEGTADSSLVTQGEAAYQKSCVACHGANLEGGAGPALKGTTLSKEEIIEVIKNGKGTMPGNLAPGQEEAIAEYLLSQG